MAVTKPNRDPLTLEKIRAALPTHIMLTPGVHKWREGDEFKKANSLVWREISPYTGRGWPTWNGKVVEVGDGTDVRRPIPPHILDNQAWWVLYDLLAPTHFGLNKYAFVADDFDMTGVLNRYELKVKKVPAPHCSNGFEFEEDGDAALEALGGEQAVIAKLQEGRLYDKWLLEQMGDV